MSTPNCDGWQEGTPSCWEPSRLKFLLAELKDNCGSGFPPGAISYGEVVEKGMLNEDTLASYQDVHSGNFVINPINLNYDLKSLRTARSTLDVRVSPAYIVLRDKGVAEPGYLRWLLHLFDVAHMKTLGAGVRQTITFQDIGDCPIRLPAKYAQRSIANFLDEKTARIDALIAEKEMLSVRAKELFTARLGTAVVEGASPGARLVSAELRGFASVRADWPLIPLKYLVSTGGGLTPSKDNDAYWKGDIPWVSPKDMKRFVLSDSIDHVTDLALAETALALHPVDSVLVVVRGMILAHTFPVALNAVPVTINQDMKALRANARLFPRYLAWLLRGLQPLMLSLTEESAHGTKALRTDMWATQRVPVPPLEEQARLVNQFDRWSEGAEWLEEHLARHIEVLREYRSSLISAAVTGQLRLDDFKDAA